MFKDVKFNITNNVPGIDINVMSDGDGYLITVKKQEQTRIGSIAPGKTITIGDKEYIVLGHGGSGTTGITTKDFVKACAFGGSNDYRDSKIRQFLNTDFYKELAKVIGKENIITHMVDLSADDGTGRGISCNDNVSLLTTERYRRYREFLPAYGKRWWTATPVSYEDNYTRCVCCVGGYGTLHWSSCGDSSGVRPFCVLNSSVLV